MIRKFDYRAKPPVEASSRLDFSVEAAKLWVTAAKPLPALRQKANKRIPIRIRTPRGRGPRQKRRITGLEPGQLKENVRCGPFTSRDRRRGHVVEDLHWPV